MRCRQRTLQPALTCHNLLLVACHSSFSFCLMEDSIDSFIRFLAVERGLSENYQFSTQRSLSDFAQWCATSKKIDNPRGVTLPVISEYLADRKRGGLSASSIKLIVVALKIFFRFLAA